MRWLKRKNSTKIIECTGLDDWVKQSDALGGPGSRACEKFWDSFEYKPSYTVNQSLNPFSEEYVDEQLILYKEISNRTFNQLENEHTAVDLEKRAIASNPYAIDPSELTIHIERLSRAFRYGAPPLSGSLLDMGCGWGLSSEIGAYLGLNVTSVDINPDLVELVNRRASRYNFNIHAVQAQFDDFQPKKHYDMILFYECLHHALRPWLVIERFSSYLTEDGVLVLAGEPINQRWWKNWGLRLDALSVYCIRKFGWFESGWSQNFIKSAFLRAGMNARFKTSIDEEIGITAIAKPITPPAVISATEIYRSWKTQGFILEEEKHLVFCGTGGFEYTSDGNSNKIQLVTLNHREKNITLNIHRKGDLIYSNALKPGNNIILLNIVKGLNRFHISSDTWVPQNENGSPDFRTLSFHLIEIKLI